MSTFPKLWLHHFVNHCMKISSVKNDFPRELLEKSVKKLRVIVGFAYRMSSSGN